MALFLILLLILLAVTGALAFVAKGALGVALGLVMAVALGVALVRWRIRRALFRPGRRRRTQGSRVEVLDRGPRFDD